MGIAAHEGLALLLARTLRKIPLVRGEVPMLDTWSPRKTSPWRILARKVLVEKLAGGRGVRNGRRNGKLSAEKQETV